MRKIELIYPEYGVRAVAELLEDQAPKTCEAIWKGLERPLNGKGLHAMFCGREVMVEMPDENKTFDPLAIPPENQTCFPIPGDILWYYFAPRQECGFPSEIYDIAIIYGRDTRMIMPLGWVPGNLFATITENLKEFADVCSRVRSEGVKDIVIRRMEE
jgi:hypothetical protein